MRILRSQLPAPYDWERVGDILMMRSVAGPISNELWDEMLAELATPQIRIVFALSFGASSISAIQRKKTADVMSVRNTPAIVVTDSRVTRGLLTAISWLGANIQSYPWPKVEMAISRLDATAQEQAKIRETTNEFRRLGES